MLTLEQAVLDTVAYGDIFQYPLTQNEVYRYLVGCKASPLEVSLTLQKLISIPGLLDYQDGYYTLAGKKTLVAVRQKRRETTARLWPKALYYGSWMAKLPFIRMVAITGSLAMDNLDLDGDLDFMVVTRGGRLWLARAMVILLVRWAAHRGVTLCPNYFLSEEALALSDQNLFTAHELVQMVPISGMNTFARLQQLNPWVETFLPNAFNLWQPSSVPDGIQNRFQRFVEPLLLVPVFSSLERWEMARKIKRFERTAGNHPETLFNADCCKGHFDDHGLQVNKAFEDRVNVFAEDLLWPKSF